jgi:hypothetical protein
LVFNHVQKALYHFSLETSAKHNTVSSLFARQIYSDEEKTGLEVLQTLLGGRVESFPQNKKQI